MKRLTSGRLGRVRAVLAAVTLLLPVASLCANAFPYDQEFLLDVARIGRAKRVPILIVEANGNASIRLWCKDVRARVLVDGDKIYVETGPLPNRLPAMMSDGQCSPERMQADLDMLAAVSQVTGWRMQGDALVFNGPKALRFRPSDH